MKCNNCGYHSFDYLAMCKNCGADLSLVRQELGLMDVKNPLPFSLDELMDEAGETASEARRDDDGKLRTEDVPEAVESPGEPELIDAELTLLDFPAEEIDLELPDERAAVEPPDRELPSFEMEGTIDFDLDDDVTILVEAPTVEEPGAGAGGLESGEPPDELGLTIDLSGDDNLNNILDGLEEVLDGKAPESEQPGLIEYVDDAYGDDDDDAGSLTLDLSDDDLGDILQNFSDEPEEDGKSRRSWKAQD